MLLLIMKEQPVLLYFSLKKKKNHVVHLYRVSQHQALEALLVLSNLSMWRTSCAMTILKWCSTPASISSVAGMVAGRVPFRQPWSLAWEVIQELPVEALLCQVCIAHLVNFRHIVVSLIGLYFGLCCYHNKQFKNHINVYSLV